MVNQFNFLDSVEIFLSSGNGGNGCVRFKKSKLISNCKPDGGNGGRGGHVILKGNKKLSNLFHIKNNSKFISDNGNPGDSNNKTGSNGTDLVIEVPLGSVIKDIENNLVLLEILNENKQYILLYGGNGGLGNFNLKYSTDQSSGFLKNGFFGIKKKVLIELKLISDVGLIGFPNSGKSTLLSVLSSASPVISNYLFTTLTPNLGIVYLFDKKYFIISDIPGILKNASVGVGLGIEFLRHVEKNNLLLFIIDSYDFLIYDIYKILFNEIYTYNNNLAKKKILIVISKSDLINNEIKKEICNDLSFLNYIFISSFTFEGILLLKIRI
jgi:GTP-binding protein